MSYVIKLQEGYYARSQVEFCWGLVDNINYALICYDMTEVEAIIEHGFDTKQEAIKNGYTVLEVETNVQVVRTKESKTGEDIKFMTKYEELLNAMRLIDPEDLKKAMKLINDRTEKTKELFSKNSEVPRSKLTRPFNR